MSDYVYAIFDFLPTDLDELPLRAGEEIDVLDRHIHFGDGWWLGRNRFGLTGIFPANHTSPYAADIRQRPKFRTTDPYAEPTSLYAMPASPTSPSACASPASPCLSPASLYSPSSPIAARASLPLPPAYPFPPSPRSPPADPDPFPAPVSGWSTAQALCFLSSVAHMDAAVVALFSTHDITGDLLLELNTRVLREEMGIVSWGTRVRIVRAVRELRKMEGLVVSSPVDGAELPWYPR